jgi:hypothetical protein
VACLEIPLGQTDPYGQYGVFMDAVFLLPTLRGRSFRLMGNPVAGQKLSKAEKEASKTAYRLSIGLEFARRIKLKASATAH